jgi:hypothetical protein
MKYAKIENDVVEQTQPNREDGFIEVGDNVVCGMIDNGDGSFSNPEMTPDQIELGKWRDLDTFLSDLTVTISNDRIIDVSPNSLLSIDNEINAMTDQDTSMWHESWGSFEVNKVDLQEARTLRKQAKDDKILELGIGA